MKKAISIMLSAVMAVGSFTAVPVFAQESESGYVDMLADVITYKAEGINEAVYAEWLPVSGATKYEVYVKAEGDSSYTKIDDELIRQYPNYFRADAIGLKAGNYTLKISALSGDSEIAVQETGVLSVKAYDRSGFAFSSDSPFKTGSGAYKDDGTLYDDAQVIYVTKDTAKTVTADIVVDKKGKKQTFTGVQAILDAKQKGYDTGHLDFRIIGTVEADDMDSFSSSAEGLQIKGSKSYSELNITVEGVGTDATVRGFGFLLRNTGNVELRNFAIMLCMDDAISIDTDNCNVWVHNMDLFYGQTGKDSDQAKGDGTIDCKAQSTYVTVSYNHLWDSGKSSLCGMADAYEPFRITYHHNWFDHSDSRHPRIRGAYAHIYNNYYDGNAKYGVGLTTGGSAFAEGNYFRNCSKPFLISLQGTDALGDGTFSSEDGGMTKQYNNIMTGSYSYMDGYEGDAVEVKSRDEQLDSSILPVKGEVGYSNFDQTEDLAVDVSNIDAPEDVPEKVMANAGRVGGGDFFWEFDNSTEDSNYSVIDGLKTAITNYQSSLVSVGGTVTKAPDTTATATSQSGIDGNKTFAERDEANEKEASALPTTSDDPKSGSSSGGSTSGDKVSEYAIQFKTSDISKKSTISSATDISCSKGTITILAASGKTVTLDTSKGIQLGGSGSTEARAIKFTASEAGKIYVTSASTGSDARTLIVADANGNQIGTIGTGSAGTVEIPEAGTYYVYSKASGINVSAFALAYNSAVETTVTTEATTEATTKEVSTETTTKKEVSTETTTKKEISTETTTKKEVSTETTTKAEVSTETTTKAEVSTETTTKAETSTETTTAVADPEAPNSEDMQYVLKVNDIDKVDGTNGKYEINKDTKEFTVDLILKNNKNGVSAMTGYIEYDPSVIQAVSFEKVSDDEGLSYTADGVTTQLLSRSSINANITNVPSTANKDFIDIGADGVKTQAELGRIKIAGMGSSWIVDNQVQNCMNDGVACRIKFKVVSEDENAVSVISYEDIETAYADSSSVAYYQAPLPVQSAAVIVNTSAKKDEEITTSYVIGDVDGNGVITATDALSCLQYVLNPDSFTDAESIKAMSVREGESKVTSTDALFILQKALNSDFSFN